jgi:hypothetical protein
MAGNMAPALQRKHKQFSQTQPEVDVVHPGAGDKKRFPNPDIIAFYVVDIQNDFQRYIEGC